DRRDVPRLRAGDPQLEREAARIRSARIPGRGRPCLDDLFGEVACREARDQRAHAHAFGEQRRERHRDRGGRGVVQCRSPRNRLQLALSTRHRPTDRGRRGRDGAGRRGLADDHSRSVGYERPVRADAYASVSEAVLDNPTSFDRPRQMCGREASAVLRLRLTDFRSYGAARLELEPLPVVLTGANGAGKTNLLESVSLLVPGRGLRGARLAELARRESGEDASDRAWAVAARVATPTGAVDIGTGRDPAAGGSERRAVRVDGTPARGQAALADYLSAVWLVPQMDRLFVEGTPGRRRFLDRLVFGFDP